jgi:hypothetical protein
MQRKKQHLQQQKQHLLQLVATMAAVAIPLAMPWVDAAPAFAAWACSAIAT